MAIKIANGPDLDSRLEKLADRLGLKGCERKAAVVERAISLLEECVAGNRPDEAAIKASLDRYIANGAWLRERLAPESDSGLPLSQSLQQELSNDRGLPA